MEKKKFYSAALLICSFIFITSIPWNLVIENTWLIFIMQMVCRCLFFVFLLLYIKKEKLVSFKFNKLNRQFFLVLPFFILCFSNFFVILFQRCSPLENIDTDYLVQATLLYLYSALIEEILFRGVVFTLWEEKKPLLPSMLYSSLIFGGIHLFNISSLSSIPPTLVQVAYCFGLGLVLSFLYHRTENLSIPIIFHFLFNFINDVLASILFNFKWDLSFFLINGGIALLFILYGIYLLGKEKQDVKN